jgi:hypothetical protein
MVAYPFTGKVEAVSPESPVMSLPHTVPRIAWLLALRRFG